MIRVCKAGTFGQYDYVVMLSRFRGKYILSRHKNRSTWEMQGGHIENGETPLDAAKRELYEESGAVDYHIEPLCDYSGEEPGKHNNGTGMVFRVEISEIGTIPPSEMAETALFDEFPSDLTYPEITKAILAYRNEN